MYLSQLVVLQGNRSPQRHFIVDTALPQWDHMPWLLPLLKRRPIHQLNRILVLTCILVADEVHLPHRRLDRLALVYTFNSIAALGRGIRANGGSVGFRVCA
jgi:hypothetical protein